MAKVKSVWVCSKCGYEAIKWSGQCPNCGVWNSLNEELKENVKKSSAAKLNFSREYSKPVSLFDISDSDNERYKTGIKELDRVLGGGLVKGSVVLLGGSPGIGKSTIILQVCDKFEQDKKILYVSGEESKHQIKLRADRLGVSNKNLYIMTETDVEIISEEVSSTKPDLVIIDSIQTMVHSEISSTAGSISQVKECTNTLIKVAKTLDIPMVIIGHVNKDGAVAGPKVLEHIVDAVLYFEGDKQMSYRILRGNKNRYGSTNEIGVFKMSNTGLEEVQNPSVMLLSGRPKNISGTCVVCVIEGTRPIFAEVQGLATTSNFGNPRRMSTGFDYNRLSLILAVLEKRAGYFFSNLDTYINVVGGIKLDEPAADLAVALSLISSLKNQIISEDTLAFGEIGLGGEIRGVSFTDERVLEAKRLGLKKCIMPLQNLKSLQNNHKLEGIELIGVKNVREAFERLC